MKHIHNFGRYMIGLMFMTACLSAQADVVFDFQKKMADKGNPEAQFKVGEMYESGRGVVKDMDKAIDMYEKAATNGHRDAVYKLVVLDARKGKVDEGKIEELKSAAAANDGMAQYYMGILYHHGAGVKADESKAYTLYRKAVLQGVLAAESGLAAIDMKREKRLEQARNRKQEEEKRQALIAMKKAEAKQRAIAENAKRAAEVEAVRKAELERRQKESAALARADSAREQAEKKAAAERLAQVDQRKKEQATEVATLDGEFDTDPCDGKSSRFLSTCR